MPNNPVYLLFNTPASFGPFFLRMAMAAIFFYQGARKSFGWFGGQGWHGTVAAWTDPAGVNLSYIVIVAVMIAEMFIAVALFLGLFTRVAGLAAVLIMAGALFYVYGGNGFEGLQLPLILMAGGCALAFIGGGHLSLDRAISGRLLPYVG